MFLASELRILTGQVRVALAVIVAFEEFCVRRSHTLAISALIVTAFLIVVAGISDHKLFTVTGLFVSRAGPESVSTP